MTESHSFAIVLNSMSNILPSLHTAVIREGVAELLRDALIEGKFRPGENLSEPALAAQLGVSRGPVREALLVLAQEGLVIHNQHRGFSVPKLTIDDYKLVSAVELPLESRVLTLARVHATEADIRDLEESKKRLVESSMKSRGLNRLLHLRFHEKIWELSGNRWLEAALRKVMVPFFTFTSLAHGPGAELNLQLLDMQHQRYVDFLKGTSSMTADECVLAHLKM